MTNPPAVIHLHRDQAASLVRLLRELERFLEECGETVEAAMATHFGLDPASEAFSAAFSLHADTIESALGTENTTSRTPT
ncbi:hypothetical protein [Streptomyces sp. NBC_00582]|uniref:hypothetical protein n=1 Tax=Streptomyces sp. NBC_00582 TaxID=2975783 RepID=UPI002E800A40|nr:hypothetical protein [Streptomyces sp. NBC_00582]WUB61717.1 hypothetical protein OG852_15600 [Streptomyces sp. NBC_00582]WUB68384.1 hypothetical protein OG852_49635 [Streptomyces sp. NBC_00582]